MSDRNPKTLWRNMPLNLLLICLLLTANVQGGSMDNTTKSPVANRFIQSLSVEERAWLQDHPVIRVAQDPGWPPVEFINERGEPSGMSIDYLKLVEQRLGITFERVLNLSWAEAYEKMKRWEIDMTTSVAVTPQRTEFWAFTKPYLTIPIVVATQADVTYISDIRELSGKKVAVVEGYAVVDWITRDFPGIQLVRVKTTLAGLQLLQRGEVFACVDNLLIIGDYQAKMEVSNIKIAGQTPYVNAQCMAVRKDWAPLATILQKALDSISEAERNTIFRKWLPVRYEQGFNYTMFWKVLAVFALLLLALVLWNRKLAGEIKSRKQAEEALRESEERHRRYLMNAPYGIIVTDEQGHYLQVNPAVCAITGYEEQELLTMSIGALLCEESREQGSRHFQTVVREGKAQGEMLFRTKNGERRWWSVTAVKISDNRFLGFHDDITDRRQAEEKILETNTLFNSVLEGTTDAIFVKDRQGRYLLVNSGVCKSIGREAHDIIGRNDKELFPAQAAEIINDIDRKVMTSGKTIHTEEKLEILGETTFWLTNKSPYFNETGGVKGLIGISREITSIKKTEEEKQRLKLHLQQAQKMESVGQLAGGVAHDFNNMLGVILGHAEMAIDQLDSSQPIFEDLEEIRRAAVRSADITRQLLAFARKQIVMPKVLDLNNTVEGMLKMLQRLIGEDISLVWLPGSGLWPVRMDPSQIDQILANLCINAQHAIQGNGKIIVETGNSTLDEKYCHGHAGFVPGEYVSISVSDNGCGMDRETLTRIFEPFFTTKDVGVGSGLGLATVYGAVKQNNGFVYTDSEPGKGTTFTIYLPRHVGETGRGEGGVVEKPAIGGQETILLVEDEPMVLQLTMMMLQHLGYTVLTAGTPGEAIRLAWEFEGTIHLLATDVIMPEMNGRDLSERLLAVQPGMRCLFMSGYTANIIAKQGVLDEGVCFIEKPFTQKELAAKIREALDSAEG